MMWEAANDPELSKQSNENIAKGSSAQWIKKSRQSKPIPYAPSKIALWHSAWRA